MSSFVLDASIAGRWLVDSELTSALKLLRVRAFEHGVVVPLLFRYEVANLLTTYSRNVDTELVSRAMAAIRSWPITIDIRGPIYDEHIKIALESGLTAYDATYLELAIRLELPLATMDAKLGAAAKKVGVKVLGLPK